MRTFLAITPDEEARRSLAAGQASARVALGPAADDWRWTPPANIHLTLHFLGSLRPEQLTRLRRVLEKPIGCPPFDVAAEGLGVFPPRGVPRVLWTGLVRGRQEVIALHRALGERLRAADCSVEPREFHPHLTLARSRGRTIPRRLRQDAALAPGASVRVAWRVSQVELYRSDLSGPVPRYEVVQHVQLGPAESAVSAPPS